MVVYSSFVWETFADAYFGRHGINTRDRGE